MYFSVSGCVIWWQRFVILLAICEKCVCGQLRGLDRVIIYDGVCTSAISMIRCILINVF